MVSGWNSQAYALVLLTVCVAAINVRGAQRNDPAGGGADRAV
jgi:hypothetical protein